MNVIAFRFEPSPTSNDDQVRPVIDGTDVLLELADDSLGIDPPEFFRQPALGIGGELLVGRCSCGVVGCGDVRVGIAVAGETVTWLFAADRSYQFALQPYLQCFRNAASDTGWESVGRTAERLVESIDFAKLEQHGCRFEWASTRMAPGRVTLSFSRQGTQRLFEVGWNAQQPADAVRQVQQWLAQHVEEG